MILNSNFLDNLESDLPQGVWSLQLDHQLKNVNVRNLFWPGYYAFHRLHYSFFYRDLFSSRAVNTTQSSKDQFFEATYPFNQMVFLYSMTAFQL